jgi:hypothetical protein
MLLPVGSTVRSDDRRGDLVAWMATAVLAIVAMCWWPVSAEAAVVSVSQTSRPGFIFAKALVYAAGRGERNETVVQATYAGQPWTVRDAGAVIVPGEGCTAIDDHAASCVSPSTGMFDALILADVTLSDLDDQVRLDEPDASGGFRLFADGGDADDTLIGAHAGGALRGGAGNDVLTSPTTPASYGALLDGGGGRDELHGGEGRETLIDGDLDGVVGELAPGPDVLDGGGGRDIVSYTRRTAPLTVDLRGSTGGEPAEHDVLRNVEAVAGGRGDDRLAGDDGPNDLRGREGSDTLFGRGGDDFLFSGGASASCGDGTDYVVNPRAREYVRPGCETVYANSVPSYPAYPAPVGRRALRYVVQCPRDEEEHFLIRCTGSLTLRQSDPPHRLVAKGSSPTGRWEKRSYRVPLTSAGSRLASRPKGVKASATLRVDDVTLMRWMIRLKLPR